MKIQIGMAILAAVAATSVNAQANTATNASASEETSQQAKPKKITDRRHPNFVRCRQEPIMGSLARKRRICMTNAAWVEYTRTGSRDSREFVEDNQPGFMITPN